MNFLRYFTAEGASESASWYTELAKPAFSPPSWAFGVAWSFIYPLIALAFILVLVAYFRKQLHGSVVLVFVVNLIANIAFTPIQFGLKNNLLASVDIAVILGTLIYIELVFWRKVKGMKGIFWILLPYLLWVSFATILQFSITVLNQ